MSHLIVLSVCTFVSVPRRRPGIAPNITAGPADSAVIDGTSVILHCETSGAPRPAITWQKGAWGRQSAVHYAAFGLVRVRQHENICLFS